MVCRGPGRISTGVSTFFTDPKNNLTELEPNLAATICPSDPGAQIMCCQRDSAKFRNGDTASRQ